MPDPISASSNSSVYDPNQPVSEAGCDPSAMSCGPALPVVTMPPVVIEGDASSKELVQGYDKRQAPDCRSEAVAAAVSCAGVAASVVGTLLSSPTGVGLLVGSAAITASTTGCYRLVHDYNECKETGAAKMDAMERCEARGGTAIASDNQITCLVPTP